MARLPAGLRELPPNISAEPERYIVAGIDNETAIIARAGSSPRGYDGISAYGASTRARRVMKSLASQYQLREVAAWPIAPLHMHCAVMEIPAGADRAKLLSNLAHDSRVRIAQPLQTFTTQSRPYDDPYLGLQSGLATMHVVEAHAVSQGAGITIAVIDTGIDVDHPDLRGVVTKTFNFVDADMTRFRSDRHGTEIAGIIAAVANNHEGIVGIAPKAHLVAIKACWQLQPGADAARCNSFTLALGLAAALDMHAQIVNLSLAGPQDPLLQALIEAGISRGVIFVGAAPAGSGRTRFLQQSGVIQVASSSDNPQQDARIYAPGEEILTLQPARRYDFASGTSLATAHVTGAIALILSARPGLTQQLLQELLVRTSSPLNRESNSPRSVDVCAAVMTAANRSDCSSSLVPDSRVAAGSGAMH